MSLDASVCQVDLVLVPGPGSGGLGGLPPAFLPVFCSLALRSARRAS